MYYRAANTFTTVKISIEPQDALLSFCAPMRYIHPPHNPKDRPFVIGLFPFHETTNEGCFRLKHPVEWSFHFCIAQLACAVFSSTLMLPKFVDRGRLFLTSAKISKNNASTVLFWLQAFLFFKSIVFKKGNIHYRTRAIDHRGYYSKICFLAFRLSHKKRIKNVF